MHTNRALKHGIFTASLIDSSMVDAESRERVVVGLVPDGTRAVRVHTPGFAAGVSTVADNVFVLRDAITDSPEAITLIQ